VVQEALLRVHQALDAGEQIASRRGFVATVTTRLAINELRSARARRERYVCRSDHKHQRDRQPRQADPPRASRRLRIATAVCELTGPANSPRRRSDAAASPRSSPDPSRAPAH
jgi:DNA-directed RNA polymerase specialized sigma24 family protein